MAPILSDFIFTNKEGLVRILHPIFLTYQPEIASKQMVNVGTISLRNTIYNLPWKYAGAYSPQIRMPTTKEQVEVWVLSSQLRGTATHILPIRKF